MGLFKYYLITKKKSFLPHAINCNLFGGTHHLLKTVILYSCDPTK